jgi:tight adherence protein C
MLLLIFIFVFVGTAIAVYSFTHKLQMDQVHLPSDMTAQIGGKKSGESSKKILNFAAKFTDPLVRKTKASASDKLLRKLSLIGKPMNVSQFMALKFMLVVAVAFGIYTFMGGIKPMYLPFVLIGFILPDMWLNGQIKKRKNQILKDLPYIIDLLNICVGAGLDFMVAVNHVIHEFRSCAMVDELKTMVKEMQMGVSRRDSLKNLSARVECPEMNSFVRTLLQADRMGTPMTNALKMHAEELRAMRFQRGEEMALKAPIKLLFPLMAFILPVVLIIVAGPILIQFTQGGAIGKF